MDKNVSYVHIKMANNDSVGSILQDEREGLTVSFDIFFPSEIETNMESAKTKNIKPVSGGNSPSGTHDFLVPR